MADRLGDWIQTFKGVQFWPVDPRPEEILIEDIAHALSLQCRFSGHTRVHYSVAEHSVRVSRVVPPGDALWGLMHDAAEAYLVDLPRPLKRLSSFGAYRLAEATVMGAVARRFDISPNEPDSVKLIDQVLLATEARDLLGPKPAEWGWMPDPLPGRIEPWTPRLAEVTFLERFAELAI
jgi:hypothetical protein